MAMMATTSTHHDQSTKVDWMSFLDDKAVFDENEWKIIFVNFGFSKALTQLVVSPHRIVWV